MNAIQMSADLRGELLDPQHWSVSLGRFGRTMNVAVALTDRTGQILGECHNPQPAWLLARKSPKFNPGQCAFSMLPHVGCRVVEEALLTMKTTKVKDMAGMAHLAVPLSLEGELLGAVVVGQVFIDYPQPLALERVAQQLQLPIQQLWHAAIARPPIRAATLQACGELIESLGQALVRERYAAVLARRLENALEEKTVLLQEVHHRVKNNMAVISSMLSLQADSVESRETAAHLRDSQMRIQSMASIHEHLYSAESLMQVRFDQYARELADSLRSLYNSEQVRIEVKIEPVNLSVDQAVPCGLIFNELIMNAFKHAFPNHRPGVITVSLAVAKPGTFQLSVHDDGIGLVDSFDPSQSRSLGLKIVTILAHQLAGRLEFHRDRGTNVAISFPSERAVVKGPSTALLV